jgi:hypothetical protein
MYMVSLNQDFGLDIYNRNFLNFKIICCHFLLVPSLLRFESQIDKYTFQFYAHPRFLSYLNIYVRLVIKSVKSKQNRRQDVRVWTVFFLIWLCVMLNFSDVITTYCGITMLGWSFNPSRVKSFLNISLCKMHFFTSHILNSCYRLCNLFQRIKENLNPTSEHFRTAIVALGHIAYNLPDKYPVHIKNIVSRKVMCIFHSLDSLTLHSVIQTSVIKSSWQCDWGKSI